MPYSNIKSPQRAIKAFEQAFMKLTSSFMFMFTLETFSVCQFDMISFHFVTLFLTLKIDKANSCAYFGDVGSHKEYGGALMSI